MKAFGLENEILAFPRPLQGRRLCFLGQILEESAGVLLSPKLAPFVRPQCACKGRQKFTWNS